MPSKVTPESALKIFVTRLDWKIKRESLEVSRPVQVFENSGKVWAYNIKRRPEWRDDEMMLQTVLMKADW